jgi:hypothetical protein
MSRSLKLSLPLRFYDYNSVFPISVRATCPPIYPFRFDLSPWDRVLLQKVTVTQLSKKFPKVRYSVHRNPSLVPILSQMHPIQTFDLITIIISRYEYKLRKLSLYNILQSRDKRNWLRAGRSDDRVSIPDGGWKCFSFVTASRPTLGLTQPPVQWVPRDFSLESKMAGA